MLVNPFFRFLERFYSIFVFLGSHLQSLLLFYLRITWGHQFSLLALHAIQKSPMNLLNHIEAAPPIFEFSILAMIGGFCLLIGFASRLAAIPTAIIAMTFLTKSPITDPQALLSQNPFPYVLTSLIVFIFGPGRISIDAWLKRWVRQLPRY